MFPTSKPNLSMALWIILAALLLSACGGQNAAATVNKAPAGAADAATAIPPTAQPTATQAATSTEAAPQADAATATPPSSGATVSFKTDILPILQNNCVKCHGGEKTYENLKLNTYADLIAGSKDGAVLTAGDSANSILVDLINSGKMPKRSPKLSDADIQKITDWINAGALDN